MLTIFYTLNRFILIFDINIARKFKMIIGIKKEQIILYQLDISYKEWYGYNQLCVNLH